jgi:hypothetical protein
VPKNEPYNDAHRAWAEKAYLDLGPTRSLYRLAQIFNSQIGAIHERTLVRWSTKNKWVKKAQQWDIDHPKGQERAVPGDETVSTITDIEMLQQAVRKKLNEAMFEPKLNAGDWKSIITGCIDAMKFVAVQLGGVSERKGIRAEPSGQAREALLALESRMRAPLTIEHQAQPTPTAAEPIIVPGPNLDHVTVDPAEVAAPEPTFAATAATAVKLLDTLNALSGGAAGKESRSFAQILAARAESGTMPEPSPKQPPVGTASPSGENVAIITQSSDK